MKRFLCMFADDRCKMTITIQISRLVYGEFHRRPAKNIKHTQRMRSQDNSSGEQVFATFTKLFLNVTSTIRNPSYPKLLDLCPLFFPRDCVSGLATPRRSRARHLPLAFFFTLVAHKERQKVTRMADAGSLQCSR